VARSGPEVADVFRRYGEAYRERHGASLCTAQRRVMSAIELCRTAALGGHIEHCDRCDHQRICYNSCLMGKFRNGELAHESIGLSVDLRVFALHYEQPLGRTLSLSGVQRFFCADAVRQGLNGFEGTPMQVSMVSGAGSTKRHSEYPVSPKAGSRNAAISGGAIVMGSKWHID
jgi:hypothetical protein